MHSLNPQSKKHVDLKVIQNVFQKTILSIITKYVEFRK